MPVHCSPHSYNFMLIALVRAASPRGFGSLPRCAAADPSRPSDPLSGAKAGHRSQKNLPGRACLASQCTKAKELVASPWLIKLTSLRARCSAVLPVRHQRNARPGSPARPVPLLALPSLQSSAQFSPFRNFTLILTTQPRSFYYIFLSKPHNLTLAAPRSSCSKAPGLQPPSTF